MTILEYGLAGLSVVLLFAFIVVSIAALNLNEAYESMRRSAQHFEDQFNSMHEIVQHYERKDRKRMESER